MKLKHAKFYRGQKKSPKRKPTLLQKARRFIDDEVRPVIEQHADVDFPDNENNRVTVAIPLGIDDHKEFEKLCKKILKPKGFSCFIGDDGVGMQDLLYVDW